MVCAPGWIEFDSKCYFFSSDEDYTWEEAAANCKDMSSVATLTSITSQKELDFIMGKALVYNLKVIYFVLSF